MLQKVNYLMKNILKLIIFHVVIGIFMFTCYYIEYSIINMVYKYASGLLNLAYSRTTSIILFVIFLRVVETYDKS
jgi:hypothetical protein